MTTLGERWAAEWPKEWVQKGREEGLAQGRREGVVQGRREGVVQGRREGVVQGRREGIDLLVRQTTFRFGGEVSARAEALLAETDDWDRFSEVSELIVRAESGPELLRRLTAIVRRSST